MKTKQHFKKPIVITVLAIALSTLAFMNAKAQCQAGFTSSVSANTTAFINTSTGASTVNPVHYGWDFGDGNYVSTSNPTHTYAFNGLYTVCLYMYNDSNLQQYCTSTFCDTILITGGSNPPCQVYAIGDSMIISGDTTSFRAYFIPSCNNVSYAWSNGATTTSISVSPTVTTTYTLIACCASSNCCDTTEFIVLVYPPCQVKANFTFNNSNDPQITFTNTSTGGVQPIYAWYFGDGTSDFGINPIHSYKYNGTYTVCLTMFDSLNWGCASYYCDKITISGAQNSPCTLMAFVTSNPNSGNVSTLTASVISGGTAPYTYIWSTGATTQTIVVSHSITTVYCVTVVDAKGCTDIACKTITVVPPCSAYFYGYQDSTNLGVYWVVNKAYGAAPITYTWSWGDGNTSTGATPSHTYAAAGWYNICLTITDGAGCSSTYCDSANVQRNSNATAGVHIVNVILDSTTSVAENNIINNWSVYPNPASELTAISYTLTRASDVQISVFDLMGNKVAEVDNSHQAAGTHTANADISSISAGMYLLQIKTNDSALTKKLSIVK